MSASIRLSVSDGIAHLTFARPSRLNAFDFAMGDAYRDACREATSSGARAIVLDAEGPAFCAGGDVLAMAAAGVTGAEVTRAARVIHEGLATLVDSPVPVVAAVRGAVAGGGIGLMLAADHVVAAPTLRIAGRYADVGLTPDLGVSTLLARAIGERRALAVLLTGVELDAATALAWGAVEEVADDPEARAVTIARAWADGPHHALGQAKRLVRAGASRPWRDSLDDEAATIGAAYDGAEARDRIAAFADSHGERGGAR
ncbi:enoyl-CoA hydratase/isomerase family protein [Demequina sp. NBRC 110055]|uniref:enoyl-CoA hydratase/isomerase family protein n=1 Tax=Demequina sp. NBRC 110055 TaxID=1570344 RepID=UPI0009FF2669|nr:enoyl-CoA hydratase/isomerase family protein [Demequina sp. NBRC 110055]